MTRGGEFGFNIHAFDSYICVEGADANIRDALERYVFPPLPRLTFAPTCAAINLRVDRDAAGFSVWLNQNLAALAVTLHDAALAAVKALDEAVVHRMKTFKAVHAGAVLIKEKALLLPGLTHAGKSSLVAELLRRGASCFSDEYALIDSEGCVHSYPRPLLLRNGGPLQSLVLPKELHASYAIRTAAVGWIMALDYGAGEVWDVHEISQGEAVMLLLRNTPHEMAQSPEMIEFFLRVATNAICYQGRRCDVAEAATHILKLIGS